MNIDRKKLAIVGLGYVGLPLAIEFGKKRETLSTCIYFICLNIKVDRLLCQMYKGQRKVD